jgi:hypothetical protein
MNSEFSKFEDSYLGHSSFKELLLTKRKNFSNSVISAVQRTQMQATFKSAYQRTALAKLPQIIELMDIMLENKLSFIIVAYHELIIEALQQALDKRKVAHINISPFFVQGDN